MAKSKALDAKRQLKKYALSVKAKFFPKFFRTGKGEYGEGDLFIGVTVPNCRLVAKDFSTLSLSEVEKLLKSKIHEERLTALFILVSQFEKGDEDAKSQIYDFYLKNLKYVNNWDLVDASSYKIAGIYLLDKDAKPLYRLAKFGDLWERRVAIVSTLAFIRVNKLKICFEISEILLDDKEDLIHKAVGWMLREAGKKDQVALVKFLKNHYKRMPRTALRYAIERFPQDVRQKYLRDEI